MRIQDRGQSGAALLIVLLFIAIVAILITTMLAVAGNESVISGLHRDGLQALELAQAGIQEAIGRIEVPHPFGSNAAAECYDGDPSDDNSFENSLASEVPGAAGSVKVCRHEVGTSGARLEIQSDARVRLARRRVSQLVIQQVKWLVPRVLQGHALSEKSMGPTPSLGSGDGYSETFLRMQNPPAPDSGSLLYAGWRISKCANENVDSSGACAGDDAPCYTHAQCAGAPWNRSNWYPGQRRGMHLDTAFRSPGQPPLLNSVDPRFFTRNAPSANGINFTCASPGATPPPPYNSVKVSDLPGWSEGVNLRSDRKPGENAMNANEPAYGCDPLDGLPYTWVKEQFLREKTVDTKKPGSDDYAVLWFRVVPYEAWFEKYWVFCNAPGDPEGCTSTLNYEKKPELRDNPLLGAVPPFPDVSAMMVSPDRVDSNGQIESGSDFGLCIPNPVPAPPTPDPNSTCQAGSVPKLVVLDTGDPNHEWILNGSDIKGTYGHGTLIINGNLTTNGSIYYYGLIIVNGKLTLGSGNVTVYGGVVARSAASLTGSIIVYAGSFVGNIPAGASDVTRLTWWMR